MQKILNILLYILKFILLLVAFGITLFVILKMNQRLNKDIMSSLSVFLPFLLLLVFFVLNILLNQKHVTGNLFYNITCNLVFLVIIVVGLRALFDTNMVLGERYGYGIDFNYFDNFISYLKLMLYGLCIANFLFMFHIKENNRKKRIAK